MRTPTIFPCQGAIKSWGDNLHSYDPEFWEFFYDLRRYLSRVSDSELNQRYKAIVRNMRALISPDRHVVPIESFLSSWYSYKKEHQTRYEFFLRNQDPPIDPPSGVLDSTAPNEPMRPGHANGADVLFRYGERQHMQPFVEQGRIRVSPASDYSLCLGDAARHDEEFHKHSYLPGEYTRIVAQDGRTMRVIGDAQRTVSLPNYFILCMSCNWDTDLFDDFGADCCVVIRDAKTFAHRLEVASKVELAGWYFHHNPVHYFDPYEMRPQEAFNAGMSKDFRFAYQREYRFIWFHTGGSEASGYKYFDLGPLDEIAKCYGRTGPVP